jgi:hypothetical protein
MVITTTLVEFPAQSQKRRRKTQRPKKPKQRLDKDEDNYQREAEDGGGR